LDGDNKGPTPEEIKVVRIDYLEEINKLARGRVARGPQPKERMAHKNHMKNGRTGSGDGRTQTFSFSAPEATSVQLVGDFTHWQQQPIELRKGGDGIWQATVDLAPGEHRYRFLVDGQWHDDPECSLHVPNPFGSRDGVRKVA